MAVGRDPRRRIAGVIDEEILGNEHQPAGRLEPLVIERAVLPAELHQVDARQVARRVVDEHVLRTGVRSVDPSGIGAGVPVIDRRVVLHPGIAAEPGRLGDLVHHLPGAVTGTFTIFVGHPTRGPVAVSLDGLHEVVGQADREIGVLEQHGAVGLVRIVSVLDQHPGLLFLAILALDELEDVGMPDLQRLHLGGPTRLAAALDHGRNLVVHPHERQRTRGLPAARQLLAMRPQRREVGARARAELEEHGLAAGQLHDVLHVVLHALDEACRRLGELVGVFRLLRLAAGLVPVPVAHGALHTVLVKQAHVEPDRRIERRHLVQANPCQVAIERLAILGRGKDLVLDSPIGDRPTHAMNQLPDALFAFGRTILAVEVFAHHDVGSQLAPRSGDFGVGLLKEHLAPFALDRRSAEIPGGGFKWVGCVDRAK